MNVHETEYPVEGMSCAACAYSVEHYLKEIEGVKSARVNYAGKSAWLEWEHDRLTENELNVQLEKAGYKLLSPETSLEELDQRESEGIQRLRRRTIISAILTLPVMVIGMFLPELPFANWIMLCLTSAVMIVGGRSIFISAWKKMLLRSANMDSLVAMGSGAAFLFSLYNTLFPQSLALEGSMHMIYYESAAVIITVILLGRFFEEKAKGKTSESIKLLMKLQPEYANVRIDGVDKQIPVNFIRIGDELQIKAGERFPVDGEVIEGESFVDESMISGEPLPVRKIAGGQVLAGTINQNGLLTVKAGSIGADTLLAKIIDQVKSAQASKAPVQELADKVSRIFVPIVIGISIIAGVFWYLLGPEPSLVYAVIVSVSVLVIACPCALGLATPTAIMVGMGKGAHKGILFSEASSLQQLREIDTIIFDKTGTLTQGKPEVLGDHLWQPETAELVLTMAKSSSHPLSKSLVENIQAAGVELSGSISITSIEEISGKGIKAVIAERSYWLGNEDFLLENGLTFSKDLDAKLQQNRIKGASKVFFGIENELKEVFYLGDKLRPEAKAFIHKLKERKLTPILLSGDNSENTALVANELGIALYKGELLPKDKRLYLEALQKEGHKVAMVGDGINDAPALAQANVSIAMGTGTDIAMESSGIILVKGNLEKIIQAIEISGQTLKVIHQNLFWAFIYNIIGIPIAAGLLYPIFDGFLLNPMFAGGAMAFSSISVVLNSLRLRKQ